MNREFKISSEDIVVVSDLESPLRTAWGKPKAIGQDSAYLIEIGKSIKQVINAAVY